MMTTNVASPSPNKGERNLAGEAVNYLFQGKRHLLVQDYPSAVSSFQESCKLFAEKYGETANECGEAYFFYGKALLELARLEMGVLGNALQGVASEEEDDESEDDQVENPESVTEEEEENSQDEEAEEEDLEEDEQKSKITEKEDSAEKTEEEGGSGISEDPQPGTSSGEGSKDKDEEEDEISNLQLAWEFLELAKLIFKRQAEGGDPLIQLKTAEIMLKLGEVSIESENYRQALDDLNDCLKLRKNLLQPDDRNLADTFYQLGLAYSFDNQFDTAVEHFEKAIQVIEDRIINLQKLLKEKPESNQVDFECGIEKELEELKNIIPDIKSKIEDTADMKRNAEEVVREAAAERLRAAQQELTLLNAAGDSSSQSTSPTKATTNITHLVKRKRKAEDEKPCDLQAKKSHTNIESKSALNGDKNYEVQSKMDDTEKPIEQPAERATSNQAVV
ncbi:protein HGV2-like [Limulus polyphemus]|uniref:Protein HGV2-like n=1 Tax=Limulus polyphemus TaxID=6850 RepID=A0ABM1BL32_LIMPO|nr:protein HGV2-like [Limulus polyphemus]